MRNNQNLEEILRDPRKKLQQLSEIANQGKRQLSHVLNHPEKALRFAIVDAKKHGNPSVFYEWEGRERGSSMGMINAGHVMLESIGTPLSIDVIRKTRSALFKDNIYGQYQYLLAPEDDQRLEEAKAGVNDIQIDPDRTVPHYELNEEFSVEQRNQEAKKLRDDSGFSIEQLLEKHAQRAAEFTRDQLRIKEQLIQEYPQHAAEFEAKYKPYADPMHVVFRLHECVKKHQVDVTFVEDCLEDEHTHIKDRMERAEQQYKKKESKALAEKIRTVLTSNRDDNEDQLKNNISKVITDTVVASKKMSIESGDELLNEIFKKKWYQSSANPLDNLKGLEESGVAEKFKLSEEFKKEMIEQYNDAITLPYVSHDIGKTFHYGVNPTIAEVYMERVIENYHQRSELISNSSATEEQKRDQALTNIVEVVANLEKMHPYKDANGRTFSVLMLNKLLIENDFSPTIMDDPNVVDYNNIVEVKEAIKQGQQNFQNVLSTGRAKEQDVTYEQLLDGIRVGAQEERAKLISSTRWGDQQQLNEYSGNVSTINIRAKEITQEFKRIQQNIEERNKSMGRRIEINIIKQILEDKSAPSYRPGTKTAENASRHL